jgi:hypothetical protein
VASSLPCDKLGTSAMFTSLSSRYALPALICVALGAIPIRAAAVTVEVARACKTLTDKAYPPREPGNPAAGSLKGGGRVAQDYFNKCVANGGRMDEATPAQAK